MEKRRSKQRKKGSNKKNRTQIVDLNKFRSQLIESAVSHMRAQATAEQGSAAKNRLIGASETVESPALAILRIIGNLHQRAVIHIRINQFLIMEGIVLGAIRERLQALRLVAHRKKVLRSVGQRTYRAKHLLHIAGSKRGLHFAERSG